MMMIDDYDDYADGGIDDCVAFVVAETQTVVAVASNGNGCVVGGLDAIQAKIEGRRGATIGEIKV